MDTKTDIATAALLQMGQNEINSIDGDSKEARTLKKMLPFAAQTVQARFDWQCLTVERDLVLRAQQPQDGCIAYNLPRGFIRVLHTWPRCEFQIESGVLYCYRRPLRAKMLVAKDEPRDWDANLTRAVVWQLASLCVQSFTQNADLTNFIITRAENEIKSAGFEDAARSASPFKRVHSDWRSF